MMLISTKDQQQFEMYNSLQNPQNNSNRYGPKFLCFLIFCCLAGSAFCFIQLQEIPHQVIDIQNEFSCFKFCDGYPYTQSPYQCCEDYNENNCVNKQGCRMNKISELNNAITTYQTLAGLLGIISFVISLCLCYCIKKNQRVNRVPPIPNADANQGRDQMHNQINNSLLSEEGVKKRRRRKIEENYESFAVESEDTNCAICMMEFTGEKAIILKCGHIFHSKCIRDWAVKQENCPVCRASH